MIFFAIYVSITTTREQGGVQMATIPGSVLVKVIVAFILTALAVLKGENVERYVRVHCFHQNVQQKNVQRKTQPLIINGENPIIIKHMEVNTK